MSITWVSVLKRSFLAGLVATLINVALFYIGSSTGAIPANLIIPSAGQPLTIGPVVFSTLIPALMAGLLLIGLDRLTSRPVRLFNIIAAAVLILSFATPFTLPGAPVSMILILELMHIVVAGTIILMVNRFSK